MLSMKTNRDMDIYKRQFKSQEFARELNKREQRRLNQEVAGRGGIEAEYRFNLDKVDQERKEIERELNKIRGGVHKQLSPHATLSSDKKFHHPKFKEFGMKDVSSRSPKLQRKAPLENNSRGREPSPMDAAMLIQYLQSFNQAHAQENNDPPDGIKGSGRIIQNKYNDLPHVQINPLIISDQSKPSEPEHSNDFEEQKQYMQTLSDSQAQDAPSNEQTATKQTSLQTPGSESGEPTPGMSSPQHSPVRRLSVDKGRYVASGTSPPKHSAVRRRSVDAGKVVHHDTRSHPAPPHSARRRFSADKGVHTPPLHLHDEKPAPSPPVEHPKTVTESEHGPAKEVETEVVETPSVPCTEEEKPSKPVIGPESFNPDGSLKTMYTTPPWEQTWEEARKARYIRTREPLERDRQLTTNEIFDKGS
ncbi:uncharacterized protein LOC111123926 [Crassostrea virginica]|uniref:Uncharacterized protein LOC111123931 n=1 Tax=Crassostrea virginica TaxID=6565 RepID=A0A8B8D2J6_CRAVI|nr:uncharacterized protein LOC111123931 [Crassostrea virginica]